MAKHRLWHRARAARPSIHQSKADPLVERYILGAGEAIDFRRFEAFFREFVRRRKLPHPIDIYDLHQLYSLLLHPSTSKENRATYVLRSEGSSYYPLQTVFPSALLIRDIFLKFTPDEDGATAGALDCIGQLLRSGWFPFAGHKDLDHILLSVNSLMNSAYVRIVNPVSPETSDRLVSAIEQAIKEHRNARWSEEIEVEGFDLDPAVVERLSTFTSERKSFGMLFGHPDTKFRLLAILGTSTSDSFFIGTSFVYNRGAVNLDGESLTLTEDMVTPNHVAVIMMTPWEADHTEKAAEMLRRGIPVAEPAGKLFLGELECGLFRWVQGTGLSTKHSPKKWEAYGRFVRDCHERGITLGDVAGRNAIWTPDRGIVGLDFEHTIITEEAESLADEQREPIWSRLREELNRAPAKYAAFERGYKS